MTVLGAGVSGSVGVSGSFAVLVMNVTTKALVESSSASNKGSLSAANGNVTVKAGDVTGLTLNTGGVAAGAAVGAGAAIETAVYRNTVTALIGNYNSVTARSILVQASADRTIKATAIMAGAGGSAAVNGSILVLSVGAMPGRPGRGQCQYRKQRRRFFHKCKQGSIRARRRSPEIRLWPDRNNGTG